MVQTTRTVAHEPSVLVPPRGVTRPRQNALHSRTLIQAKKNTALALNTKNALHDALALVQQNQRHDALALAHPKTETRDALAPVYQDQRHATHLNWFNKIEGTRGTRTRPTRSKAREALALVQTLHNALLHVRGINANERSHSSKKRTTHIRTRPNNAQGTFALVDALLHSSKQSTTHCCTLVPRKRACTLVPRNAHALKKRICARQFTKKNTNLSIRATEQSLEMHSARPILSLTNTFATLSPRRHRLSAPPALSSRSCRQDAIPTSLWISVSSSPTPWTAAGHPRPQSSSTSKSLRKLSRKGEEDTTVRFSPM